MNLNSVSNSVDLTIIVPIYNGAKYCRSLYFKCLEVLKKSDRNYELIFVDDGSTDDTLTNLLTIQKEGNQLKIVKLHPNQGQHFALMQGLKKATGKAIIIMDDDQEFALDYIDVILQKFKAGYDCVFLWRNKRNISILRKLVSWMMNILISGVTRKRIHDFGGTKAFGNRGASLLYKHGSVLKMGKRLRHLSICEIKVNNAFIRYSRYDCKKLIRLFLQALAAFIN